MKTTLALLLLLAASAHAQPPAGTLFVTENQNGGTIAIYRDTRCYSGMGIYTESPVSATLRGCVTNFDDQHVYARWSGGADTQYDYTGWSKVGN